MPTPSSPRALFLFREWSHLVQYADVYRPAAGPDATTRGREKEQEANGHAKRDRAAPWHGPSRVWLAGGQRMTTTLVVDWVKIQTVSDMPFDSRMQPWDSR